MIEIYPVIHHLNEELTIEQFDLAFEAGADGVFLISHDGKDSEITSLAFKLKFKHKDKKIGINLLSTEQVKAMRMAEGLDMIWYDYCGVSSSTITDLPKIIQRLNRSSPRQVFGGVAFKYQLFEPNPIHAATNMQSLGFVPTTSGTQTGSAPDLQKIVDMSEAVKYELAIASGMDCDNIEQFAPYLKYVLVASGVSDDMHRFNFEKLYQFIVKAKTSYEKSRTIQTDIGPVYYASH